MASAKSERSCCVDSAWALSQPQDREAASSRCSEQEPVEAGAVWAHPEPEREAEPDREAELVPAPPELMLLPAHPHPELVPARPEAELEPLPSEPELVPAHPHPDWPGLATE